MSAESAANDPIERLVQAMQETIVRIHGVKFAEAEAQAAKVWEQFKAEQISGPQFVAGIEAINKQLPEGCTIRFK